MNPLPSWRAPPEVRLFPHQNALRFGDFDGDRRTDVFALVGNRWQFSAGGSGAWQPLAASGYAGPALQMVLADFTGDGKADVFHRPVSVTSRPAPSYMATRYDVLCESRHAERGRDMLAVSGS